ncbi:MAG: hypothetical protein QUV35_08245 [Hydrogenophaga sp.]|uniref:hypothetical protein n=1 Tax=Hydrogenophaga sp. TaxID=1904254 RepID=UPI002609AD95|nr:hypothetical protein [Hydrogenophaga sp.]MDM7942605.1 hypothetical protein [Hydrogenophaga sp.]
MIRSTLRAPGQTPAHDLALLRSKTLSSPALCAGISQALPGLQVLEMPERQR